MQGKTVLITGGGKRVGAAICRLLHCEGANLMVHYRSSAQQARALQEELNAIRADSVALIQGDLLKTSSFPNMVATTIETFGSLDVLVNNASSFYPTAVGDITEANWDDLVGTNLKAPLFLAQAAATELRLRQGAIVNIADIHAERPLQGHLLYSLAKAGLIALTRALAQELAPQVRVNAVSPGVIMWPENAAWQDEEQRRKIVAHTLLKRQGEPEDIARTVQFLLNDAPYITGQIISVDGGRSINI